MSCSLKRYGWRKVRCFSTLQNNEWTAPRVVSNIESRPLTATLNSGENLKIKVAKLDLAKLKSEVELYAHQDPKYFLRFYFVGFGNAVAFTALAFTFYKANEQRLNDPSLTHEQSKDSFLGKGAIKDSDMVIMSAGVALLGYAALFRLHTLAQRNVKSLTLTPSATNAGGVCQVRLKSCALLFPKTVTASSSTFFTTEKLQSGPQTLGNPVRSTAARIWSQLKGDDSKPITLHSTTSKAAWKVDRNGNVLNAQVFDALFYRPYLS